MNIVCIEIFLKRNVTFEKNFRQIFSRNEKVCLVDKDDKFYWSVAACNVYFICVRERKDGKEGRSPFFFFFWYGRYFLDVALKPRVSRGIVSMYRIFSFFFFF